MKSSLKLKCKCGKVLTLKISGTQRFQNPDCPDCRAPIWLVDNSVVSTRVFSRSTQELESGDFTLAIILSAMAIECDLARLYMKWKEVDLILVRTVVQSDKDLWEKEFRDWNSILLRMDKVCAFLRLATLIHSSCKMSNWLDW